LRRARPVGVLDAEDENAAVMARVEPVEERGSSAANVKMAGGTRSEAHADGLGHRFLFYSERRERDAGRGAVKPRPDRQNLERLSRTGGGERAPSIPQRQIPGGWPPPLLPVSAAGPSWPTASGSPANGGPGTPAVISVLTKPGRTQVTVTPRSA